MDGHLRCLSATIYLAYLSDNDGVSFVTLWCIRQPEAGTEPFVVNELQYLLV